jgi:hypothetical protein
MNDGMSFVTYAPLATGHDGWLIQGESKMQNYCRSILVQVTRRDIVTRW